MDNNKYYEDYDWKSFNESNENVAVIKSLIPADVHSIIDIGCGNGLITNELSDSYDILGVDRSNAALELVKTKKLNASCDNVPVDDASFDLLLSSELLEHLDDDVFNGTIKEFNRISKKYILISVPFEESLEKGMIQHPKCGTIFHRSYHMRRFSVESILQFFPDYKLITFRTFGLKVREYRPALAKLKQRISPAASWIPPYMTKNEPRKAFCPVCEESFVYSYKFNPLASGIDAINILTTGKKPFHVIVLLEKK